MKLQLYPLALEITPTQDVELSQEGSAGKVRVTYEQIPFLVELLYQVRSKIEEDRQKLAAEGSEY